MTDKYGVGYILTNKNIGFYYNDQTNILLIKNEVIIYSDFKDKSSKGCIK